MSKLNSSSYGIALHLLLVALAVATFLLARENRQFHAAFSGEPPEPLLVAGARFSGYQFSDLDGEPQRLEFSDASGRDHVLFFFTTTCPVCAETQPVWKALYESLNGEAEILAVSFDPPEVTRAYKDRMELPFPVLVVPNPNAFAEQFRLTAVPFTVQIASDGEVRNSWLGPLSDEDVRNIVSVFSIASGG